MSEKKTIHLFLASSITDLDKDREAIGNFINTLNNIYNDQNLFIHLHKCEDESQDHSIINGGTQKSLNEEIRESDLCIVLFWHKAGDVTEQELQVALEGFKLNDNPKIVVYFKNLAKGESLAEDVRRIMTEIDQKYLHYHREYSHIDTLKLGIVTQLQVHGFIRADMKVEKENVTISGQKVVSTQNIPVYSQNKKYLKLVKKCHAAEEKCEQLFRIFEQDKNNTEAYNAYQKAVKIKLRAQEQLKEIADKILNIGTNIAITISSSSISERIREAIKCFDCGDYDGVQNLLRPDEIEERFSRTNMKEEMLQIERQHCIDEFRWRISSLEAQGKWKEAQDNFERATIMVEGALTSPKTIMLEYAKFLHRQRKYKKSLEICTRLQSALMQYANAMSKEDIATLYDLQGELCYETEQFDKAESFLLKAIELRKVSEGLGQEQDLLIAESSVKLARVYYKVTRFFESETLYLQTLERYKAYDTDAIESVDAEIARTSIALGDLYYMINRHEDARKLFINAYHKYTELVNSGDKRYIAELAESCTQIAFLDIAVYSHCKRERYYVQAMKIKQLLTQKEPIVYFLFLERILKKLGQYWTENGDATYGNMFLQEAERIMSVIENKGYKNSKEEYRALDYAYYGLPINKLFIESLLQESLRHYKVLADDNPEAYEPSLAQAYDVTGVFYTQIGEKQKAERNYAESIAIRERLVVREQPMKSALAASYSNLSKHYVIWNQNERAEKYALQAIEIYRSLTQGETGAFYTDLARNYFALADFYAITEKNEQAEECYKDSIMLYIKLFEKSPRAYIDRIINTINNVITLFDPIGSTKWMEEFVDEGKVTEWLKNMGY